MKKFGWMIGTAVLMTAFTACGGSPSGGAEEVPQDSLGQKTPESEAAEPSGDTGQGDILIVYFSWSGNTETLAGMIQAETGGDLFEIEPAEAYTDDYNELLEIASQEQEDGARPALTGKVEDWADYGTVFVGYPNWWNDAPMAVLTFLESYDCSGKRVIPFCTSGGGGFGRSLESVKDAAAGAEVLDGFHVSGSSVANAGEDVAEWIAELGIDG